MIREDPDVIEMTIEGDFVTPAKPPLSSRVAFWAMITAVLAGALSIAVFALWIALLAIPVALGAAAVAAIARGGLGFGKRIKGDQSPRPVQITIDRRDQ